MPIFERQQDPRPSHDLDIMVVGTGGVGTWSALTLAMSGICRTLWLVDGDKVEESNLNRLPYTEEDIGEYKVDAAANLIEELRPNQLTIPVPRFLDTGFNAPVNRVSLDYVVFGAEGREANDSMREVFSSEMEADKAIFIGAEGDSASIRTGPVPWQMVDDDDFEYDNVWVGCAMAAGLYSVMAIRRRERGEPLPQASEVDLDFVDQQNAISRLEAEMSELQREKETLEEAKERLRELADEAVSERETTEEENSRLRRENSELRLGLNEAMTEIEKLVEEKVQLRRLVDNEQEGGILDVFSISERGVAGEELSETPVS